MNPKVWFLDRLAALRRDYRDSEYAVLMDRSQLFPEKIPWTPVWLETLLVMAGDVLNGARCAVQGHDPQDESTAGPETGNVLVTCKRCGRVLIHRTLY